MKTFIKTPSEATASKRTIKINLNSSHDIIIKSIEVLNPSENLVENQRDKKFQKLIFISKHDMKKYILATFKIFKTLRLSC